MIPAQKPEVVPPNVKFEVDDIEDEWTYSRPFEYIHSRLMTSSLSDWPVFLRRCFEEIGLWNYENTMMGLEGYTMAPLTRALDWMPAEVDVFLIDVRNDLKDRSIHAYWPQYAIVGRKPQKEESPAAA
ncbi:Secondary metabolism regulator LAE1 [Colletotrichum sp. SAR 10_96]|nr:Secondary metabolism regulator LAE1 [Colletotrichum sp. SAR 10_96]